MYSTIYHGQDGSVLPRASDRCSRNWLDCIPRRSIPSLKSLACFLIPSIVFRWKPLSSLRSGRIQPSSESVSNCTTDSFCKLWKISGRHSRILAILQPSESAEQETIIERISCGNFVRLLTRLRNFLVDSSLAMLPANVSSETSICGVCWYAPRHGQDHEPRSHAWCKVLIGTRLLRTLKQSMWKV